MGITLPIAAPWVPILPTFQPGVVTATPLQFPFLPPPPQVPIAGVPWQRHALAPSSPPPSPIPTPAPDVPTQQPGPPIAGVPWRVVAPFSAGPANPGPPTPTPQSLLKPLVLRLEVQEGGTMPKRRTERFGELVSTIFNSLFAQGILVQTGADTYKIVVSTTTTGATGTFSSGAF
jgi:hypothetical protein